MLAKSDVFALHHPFNQEIKNEIFGAKSLQDLHS